MIGRASGYARMVSKARQSMRGDYSGGGDTSVGRGRVVLGYPYPSPPTTLRYPCGVGVLMCPGPPRDAGAGPAAGGPSVGPATPDPLAPHGTGPRPGPLPVCPARGLPHRWSAHPLPGRISANCRPLSAVPREPAGSWPWHPTANVWAPCTSLVRHGCSLVSRQTGPYRSIEGDHVQEALLHRFSGAAQSLPIPACSMRAVANVRLHR